MTKVLVLMSTYNGKKYVEEQIQSILDQKDVECKLLIRDDGSKDGTIDLLNEIASTHAKGTITILCGDNVGVYNSFTSLVKYASQISDSYDYYAFSDQDDIWLPDKIRSAVNMLSALPKDKPLVYCSNSTMIDKERNKIKNLWEKESPNITKERILFVNYAQGCTMVFNKSSLDMYNKRSCDLGKLHDFIMAFIGVYYGEIVYDENSYLLYRQHEGNVVGGSKKKYNMFQIIRNLLTFDSKRDELCRNILEHFDDLNKSDLKCIKMIAYYRNNIINKLRLLCHPSLYYKSFKENVLIGVRVMLGTF